MSPADTNVIAAELRAGYGRLPRNSKLGYSTAITQVANALERQLGAAFDRNAFMEAATLRPPKQEPLALEVVR
jgi:hypothetical protein